MVATLRKLKYDAHLKILKNEAFFPAAYGPHTHVQSGHLFTWNPDYLFGTAMIEQGYACLPPYQRYGYRDPAICADMRRARALAAHNREREANAVWTRVDHELVDRAPFVAYGAANLVELVSRRVGNYRFTPLYGLMLGQAWVR